ncbi:methyltransferase domain-containing protein [Antrihabitans sp. YC2-6]|nr:methyltransferase domain-containing protein [Antrihabitans sp. YC2-6]
MFALDDELTGTILDCPGGASSFTAEATRRGARVTAVDPVYTTPATELTRHILAETERGTAWTTATSSRYVWDFYGSPDGHSAMRRAAAHQFAHDLVGHPERYVAGQLPSLPFEAGEFDIVLSSHLLFTYADRLDFAFHTSAIAELLRVTRGEVRVFPLADQAGAPQPDLVDHVRRALAAAGATTQLRTVSFEFQRGVSEMLVVRHG